MCCEQRLTLQASHAEQSRERQRRATEDTVDTVFSGDTRDEWLDRKEAAGEGIAVEMSLCKKLKIDGIPKGKPLSWGFKKAKKAGVATPAKLARWRARSNGYNAAKHWFGQRFEWWRYFSWCKPTSRAVKECGDSVAGGSGAREAVAASTDVDALHVDGADELAGSAAKPVGAGPFTDTAAPAHVQAAVAKLAPKGINLFKCAHAVIALPMNTVACATVTLRIVSRCMSLHFPLTHAWPRASDVARCECMLLHSEAVSVQSQRA